MDWPYVSDSGNVYHTQNNDSIVLGRISGRLPFESIITPDVFLKDLQNGLYYLDPSHHSDELNDINGNTTIPNTPHIPGNEIRYVYDSVSKKLYYSAINNFLSETINLFIKSKSLVKFTSRKFLYDELIPVIKDSTYSLDIILNKKPSFSMFNNKISGSSDHMFVPQASLFGPPSKTHNSDITSSYAYYPYSPTYLHNIESNNILRVKYIPSSDSVKLGDILNNLQYEVPNSDTHNDIISSLSFQNKLDLRSNLFLNLQEVDSTDNSSMWVIQTKYETPLINYSGCSTVVSSSL